LRRSTSSPTLPRRSGWSWSRGSSGIPIRSERKFAPFRHRSPQQPKAPTR
jgi:hypothetical protein